MSTPQDTLAVHELLAQYANSFDMKDWDGLGSCLSDTLHTDYSQLRKTPPKRSPGNTSWNSGAMPWTSSTLITC